MLLHEANHDPIRVWANLQHRRKQGGRELNVNARNSDVDAVGCVLMPLDLC